MPSWQQTGGGKVSCCMLPIFIDGVESAHAIASILAIVKAADANEARAAVALSILPMEACIDSAETRCCCDRLSGPSACLPLLGRQASRTLTRERFFREISRGRVLLGAC